MLLIGRIERLQKKEKGFSYILVTQGEMAGKVVRFHVEPRYFSNIRKGAIVRMVGNFDGDKFVVSKPTQIVKDYTSNDMQVLIQNGLGVSREDLYAIFKKTSTVNFNELAGWYRSAGQKELQDVKQLPRSTDVLRYVDRIIKNQDSFKVLELVSKTGHDLSTAARARNLFYVRAKKRYPDSSTPVADYLYSEPYVLAQLENVSWKEADELAAQLGMPRGLDPRRIAGAVHAFLWKKAQNGHCFYPRTDTVFNVWLWLDGKNKMDNRIRQQIENVIQSMVDKNQLIFEFHPYSGIIVDIMQKEYPGSSYNLNKTRCGVLYLPAVYWSEKHFSSMLAKCALAEPDIRINADKLVKTAEKIAADEFGYTLNEKQKEAVTNTAKHTVSVVPGAAGAGKTTLMKIITRALQESAPEIEIVTPLAPTGSAAQLLGGSTFHKYIKLGVLESDYIEDNGNYNNKENDINDEKSKFYTLDEVSMATIIMFRKFMEKITPGARILIMGDPNQLQAIGPGAVLKDFKERELPVDVHDDKKFSDIIPVTVLDRIYRQAVNNPVLENAWRILDAYPGAPAEFLEVPGQFEIIPGDAPRDVAKSIKDKVKELLNNGVAFKDIMVLSPKYDGPAGVARLNQHIGKIVNPNAENIEGTSFYMWDCVIAVQNNYQNENDENRIRDTVMNGTRGIIINTVENENNRLVGIQYDGKESIDYYYPEELELYLKHAYAVSCHKAQGGQAKVIIIAGPPTADSMLDKMLLYTSVTRSTGEAVFLVGMRKLWQKASEKILPRRYSKFIWRLHDDLGLTPALKDWKLDEVLEKAAVGKELDPLPVDQKPPEPGIIIEGFPPRN